MRVKCLCCEEVYDLDEESCSCCDGCDADLIEVASWQEALEEGEE
jgi:hypothetical protein